MAFETLLQQIDAEIGRLQQAKQLLSGQTAKRGPGRPAKSTTSGAAPATGTRKRRVLSQEARKRIAAAQKKRWAKVHAEKKKSAAS